MNNISAIIIAKDEENQIRECIDNLSFCEEVIVVNNGFLDNTAKIAESLGAKVFNFSSNNFAELRNFGLSKAQNPWIFYVDADEKADDLLKKSVIEAIKSGDFDSYTLKRKNFYLGNNEWPHVESIKRLFNKNKLSGWKGEIHESPEIEGKSGELSGFLIHKTHRNLESMVEKTNSWSQTEAMLRFKNNHPKMSWWRFARVMLTAFLSSYILQKGYKAKGAGLIESMYQAFSMFITYAKLWELQNKKDEAVK